MIPFTNEEITALLYDAMPTARALMERKTGETLAVVEREKAATLAAFTEATPVVDTTPVVDAAPYADVILTAPAGSGE